MISDSDYIAIIHSYSCDNCKNNMLHPWNNNRILERDYCEQCSPDVYPPSNYRPFKRTVQEKMYYDRYEQITDGEIARFHKKGY